MRLGACPLRPGCKSRSQIRFIGRISDSGLRTSMNKFDSCMNHALYN